VATVSQAFHALFAALERRDDRAFDELWLVDDPTVTRFGVDDLRAQAPRFEWRELEVHERAEVAWVNARGSILVGGTPSPYRVTAVLLHTYAGWRWHTFNGAIPD